MKNYSNSNPIPYLVIAVTILFCATSGCTSYKEKGVFRESHLIYSTIEPTNIELYRQLLPENFSLPQQPVIAVFIADYSKVFPWPMTPYKEGGILLRCKYKDKEGWFVKDMPLTSWVAMKGGRSLGYPKYLVDDISLKKTASGWRGQVTDDKKVKIRLLYNTGLTVKLFESQKEFITQSASFSTGNIFLLDPPGEGPTVQEIEFIHAVEPAIVSELGMVKVFINSNDPWASLFPKDGNLPGVFIKFTGGIYIENKKLN